MYKLQKRLPSGYVNIIETYGDPGSVKERLNIDKFCRDNLKTIILPFPMKCSWIPTSTSIILAHKKVIDSLVDALNAIHHYALIDQNGIEIDLVWGGCFEFRTIRNGSQLSAHSWGIAADICPEIGKYGNIYDRDHYPHVIVDIFESRGWEWGGRWTTPDAMHFQACTDY